MNSIQTPGTNSPTLNYPSPTVCQGKCAPQHEVSVVRQEQIALDEGVDYFSAQGALHYWSLQEATVLRGN